MRCSSNARAGRKQGVVWATGATADACGCMRMHAGAECGVTCTLRLRRRSSSSLCIACSTLLTCMSHVTSSGRARNGGSSRQPQECSQQQRLSPLNQISRAAAAAPRDLQLCRPRPRPSAGRRCLHRAPPTGGRGGRDGREGGGAGAIRAAIGFLRGRIAWAAACCAGNAGDDAEDVAPGSRSYATAPPAQRARCRSTSRAWQPHCQKTITPRHARCAHAVARSPRSAAAQHPAFQLLPLAKRVRQAQPEYFARGRRRCAVDKGREVVAGVDFEASGNWVADETRLAEAQQTHAPVELQSAVGTTETGAKNLREGVAEGWRTRFCRREEDLVSFWTT